MKLNYEGRKELRNSIQEQLKNVPDGVKLNLNEVLCNLKKQLGVEDVYDYLLFETFDDSDFTGTILKSTNMVRKIFKKVRFK